MHINVICSVSLLLFHYYFYFRICIKHYNLTFFHISALHYVTGKGHFNIKIPKKDN